MNLQLYIICLATVMSCHKNNLPEPIPDFTDTSETYVAYTAGGQNFVINGGYSTINTIGTGSYATKSIQSGVTTYTMIGQSGFDDLILLQLQTDSLKAITYNSLYYGKITANGKQYNGGVASGSSPLPYSFNINISKHSGGSVNATFSGDLVYINSVSPVTFEHIQITNGVFHNLKVAY